MPDASLAEEWAAKERSRLEAAKAAMGEEELADVIRSTADLKRAQLAEDSAEDLATIPRVGLADLEAKACLSRVTASDSIRNPPYSSPLSPPLILVVRYFTRMHPLVHYLIHRSHSSSGGITR